MKRLFAASVGVLIISGCQNPYAQFYRPVNTVVDQTSLLPHTGPTQFVTCATDEWRQTVIGEIRKGYTVIGEASFEANANRDYTADLKEYATEVHADIVILAVSSAGSRNVIVPLMHYNPGQTSTTYSQGQVNAYGNGTSAYGTYNGTSTTTSPGSFSTSYVPMAIPRGNFGATFLRKRTWVFGAQVTALTDDQRQALQRNAGAVVVLVVDDTPAFFANILPGDVIIAVNGDPVSATTALPRMHELAGMAIKLTVLRAGREIIIPITLGSAIPAQVPPVSS